MTDSAPRKLADDPSSRRRCFKMLGGAGAGSAVSVLLAACGDDKRDGATVAEPTRDDKASDLKIVSYALFLEYLEAGFYHEVVDSGVIKDTTIGDLVKRLQAAEQEHVDALTARAGRSSRPRRRSTPSRRGTGLNELVGRGFGEGRRALEGSLPDGAFGKPMGIDAVPKAVQPLIAG